MPNRPVDDELELEEELELLDDEAITGTAALTTTAKIIEKKCNLFPMKNNVCKQLQTWR